ncbi:MAG: tight adherence protein [Candidatus Eremiobacteraeota bacterium]|nr:tight adherence protein [Candidatus Eremiobacteraeota bacterium]
MSPAGLAFAAAALAIASFAEIAAGAAAGKPGRADNFGAGLAAPFRAAAGVFARAGSEGRDPAAAERRRLLTCGAGAAFAAGLFLFGIKGAVPIAAAAPTAASRALRARRERYRRAVEAGAADVAIALADALSGGHSVRGAVISAAGSLAGPPGNEMRRVAAELELGARTDDALEGMRRRIRSPAVDVIVAGALLQRRAGGDLAQLLRGSARAFEDEARLLGEVRAATAQARFTGMVVVLLPLGAAGMAELASPGFVARLAAFPLSAWLMGMALGMQAAAAFTIRKLARLRA